MIHVIPAILANDEADFLTKLARVRGFAPKVHIDIMDGEFVPNTTWAPPEKMHHLLGDLPFEIHLMVTNPEHLAPVWLAAGAERVVIHAESTNREKLICRATVDECTKLSLAINPETPVSRIMPDLESFAHVTVMSVPPGLGGQQFAPISLEKIEAIKKYRPGVVISIDGGIKLNNIRDAVTVGAEHIVVGSAIMNASDPEAAYNELLEAATKHDVLVENLQSIPPPEEPHHNFEERPPSNS